MTGRRKFFLSLMGIALVYGPVAGAQMVPNPPSVAANGPTYADLVGLADGTPMVVHARILRQIALPAERAPNVAPGSVRLYIEAETVSLLSGNAPIGSSLRYLVDVPLTAKGKPPKLKKQEVIVFARPVAGQADQLQLVDPRAQLIWSPQLEARLKPILAALLAPDAPPPVTGVRDALSMPGNLAGESETQIFLTTSDSDPAALSIIRRPGMTPRWGVSWTELVDQSAKPPAPETLAWYRLACGLPPRLPDNADLSQSDQDRARAAADYRFVIEQLGPCRRNRD